MREQRIDQPSRHEPRIVDRIRRQVRDKGSVIEGVTKQQESDPKEYEISVIQWKDAERSPDPELLKPRPQRLRLEFFPPQDPRDQETRQHEKELNTRPAKEVQLIMKAHHQQDRNRPQPIQTSDISFAHSQLKVPYMHSVRQGRLILL